MNIIPYFEIFNYCDYISIIFNVSQYYDWSRIYIIISFKLSKNLFNF